MGNFAGHSHQGFSPFLQDPLIPGQSLCSSWSCMCPECSEETQSSPVLGWVSLGWEGERFLEQLVWDEAADSDSRDAQPVVTKGLQNPEEDKSPFLQKPATWALPNTLESPVGYWPGNTSVLIPHSSCQGSSCTEVLQNVTKHLCAILVLGAGHSLMRRTPGSVPEEVASAAALQHPGTLGEPHPWSLGWQQWGLCGCQARLCRGLA